ncbi:MAG: FMN reductase [Pseudoclavibacter sp.]
MTARTIRVAGINGSYSTPSKTAALVDLIAEEAARSYETDYRRIDVAFLGAGLSTALARDGLDREAAGAVDAVEQADLVIAASPVYRGSYSGLFKHFVDLLDQYALADKPVILAATGGSDRHMLMIDHELRPLFAFMQAHTSPGGVYASNGDFAGQAVLNPEVHSRIELAVRDLAPVLEREPVQE